MCEALNFKLEFLQSRAFDFQQVIRLEKLKNHL